MATKWQATDISNTPELLRLADEVTRSGSPRLLTSGKRPLAVLAPVESSITPRRRRRAPRGLPRDSILEIIGIAASAEPTDISQDKQRYLAEAYEPKRP